MKLFKRVYNRLFCQGLGIYQYEIIDKDTGDAMIMFGDINSSYILDLDWGKGVMDIEFNILGSKIPDTTNLHNQYKVLNTVRYITKKFITNIEKKKNRKFHTIVFKSSKFRNGDIDEDSAKIRSRFFIRYVMKEYPNANVLEGPNDSIIIKLN